MNTRRIQRLMFLAVFTISLSSSLYLNDQAKDLQEQGYVTTSQLFEEDFENLLPQVKVIDTVVDHIKRSFVF